MLTRASFLRALPFACAYPFIFSRPSIASPEDSGAVRDIG